MAEAIKGLDQIKAKLKKLDSSHNVKIHKAAARAGATALRKGSIKRMMPAPGNAKKLGIRLTSSLVKAGLIHFKIGPSER